MPKSFPRRRRVLVCVPLLLLTLASGQATPSPSTPVPGAGAVRLLRDGPGLYPRAIRLTFGVGTKGRILASVVVPPQGGQPGQGAIYESRDEGNSFQQVGAVTDPASVQGLCCSTLFELPRRVGGLSAGTLLWAASIGQDAPDRRMALNIWKSSDAGRHWSFLSSCAKASSPGGLWEPEFSLAADGRLVCHYSDETQQPQHSQVLAQAVSSDSLHWTHANTVALPDPSLRPGMPVVRRLPDGHFVMSYEVCGGDQRCAAHLRSSPDGLHWGAATSAGTPVRAAGGQVFTHAPTLAWSPGPGKGGTLLLVGQLLEDGSGLEAGASGGALMVSTSGVRGPWSVRPTPFRVLGVYDNYCPNYSSALLPSQDGKQLLMIATAYDGDMCKPYFRLAPMSPVPVSERR